MESRKLTGDQLRVYTWAAHFVNVMSCYTPGLMGYGTNSDAMIEPGTADEIVAGSRLLNNMAKSEPSLVGHPLQKDKQHWISTGTDRPVRPSRARLVMPSVEQADVKPMSFGLYTSTALSAGYSMWRAYISLDTKLYPPQWYTWEMKIGAPNIRVAEITSAAEWVEFVATYGQIKKDFIYPDWTRVGLAFDAVHITLPAVAAAQGFCFYALGGIIPPAFWDVETTFWLRWVFSGAQLVDRADGGR